jgi:hypothetical protein
MTRTDRHRPDTGDRDPATAFIPPIGTVTGESGLPAS